MKDSIAALRGLEKQLYAYQYALSVMEFDEATAAPADSADGRAVAAEVLSRARFDLLINDDTAALLALAAGEAEDEQPERKLLKRELRAQALKRLEDSARTLKDYKNVIVCVITTALIQFNFSSAFEPTGFINGFI